MRKFKFNIDDWTGGDTISNSMGDAVASTVVENHSFEITTPLTTAVCFGVPCGTTVFIDWGDGESETINDNNKYSYGNPVTDVVHTYDDDDFIPRLIKFTIKSDSYRQIILTDMDKYYTSIDDYKIVNGFKNTTGDFIKHYFTRKMNITVSSNVKAISDFATAGIHSVNDIIVSDSVETIDCNAFAKLHVYGTISIPDNIDFSRGLFSNCINASDRILDLRVPLHPEKVLPMKTCLKCKGFNIIIPEGYRRINAEAFREADFVKGLNLPSTLNYIEVRGFYEASIKGDIIIPDNITILREGVFGHVKFIGDKGSLKLGKNLILIQRETFIESEIAGDLVIPDNVEEIHKEAFSRCKNLTNVTFGSGIKVIGDRALLVVVYKAQ